MERVVSVVFVIISFFVHFLVLFFTSKPKNQRARRIIEDKAPKLIENHKKAMFIRGQNCNAFTTNVLKDIYLLKKPYASFFKRKNLMKPFEDSSSIEFFSDKTDSSLFMFGSHNKKRPNNIVIGRLFDHQLLDMIELGIESYTAMNMFKGLKPPVGAKPCMVFSGDAFETEFKFMRLKSLLIDFFCGQEVPSIGLAGIEHVISITVVEAMLYFRVYRIHLKKSGVRQPRVELEETGPRFDATIRRIQLAPNDIYKQACRKPKAIIPKKVKNKSSDVFGSKLGQIHMTRQDYGALNTRRMKGLKRKMTQEHETNKKVKND